MTMARHLSNKTLGDLPAAIIRPTYDRSLLQPGILHLGIGAFHRAHQAVYTDTVLGSGDLRWGIVGASLRSAETRDALAPQDGLYTVAARDGADELLRVIGSSAGLVVAPESPEALLAAMTRPEVKIISLTVTEKGYCHAPASGTLDDAHPDVRHDLATPGSPRTAIGFIVEAIARRRAAGHAPFTLLSCDNLPANGRTLKQVATRFAELRDPDLGRFVADEIASPSTMVDRIVPATTDADRAAIAERLGLADAWPVMTEPFSQWVIEDDFPAGRPEWEQAGATFVKDVDAYELMKLRLLNGSHSTLAYLGYLAGHETVAAAMAGPGFAELIKGLMDDEVSPTLPPLPGIDLAAYKADLIARFRNSGTAPSHVADRDGRLAETAPAPAQHDPRTHSGWRTVCATGARGCRLDALCHRHRRKRWADRRSRPARRHDPKPDAGDRFGIRSGHGFSRAGAGFRHGPSRRTAIPGGRGSSVDRSFAEWGRRDSTTFSHLVDKEQSSRNRLCLKTDRLIYHYTAKAEYLIVTRGKFREETVK